MDGASALRSSWALGFHQGGESYLGRAWLVREAGRGCPLCWSRRWSTHSIATQGAQVTPVEVVAPIWAVGRFVPNVFGVFGVYAVGAPRAHLTSNCCRWLGGLSRWRWVPRRPVQARMSAAGSGLADPRCWVLLGAAYRRDWERGSVLRRAIAWSRDVGTEGDGDVIPELAWADRGWGCYRIGIPSMVTGGRGGDSYVAATSNPLPLSR